MKDPKNKGSKKKGVFRKTVHLEPDKLVPTKDFPMDFPFEMFNPLQSATVKYWDSDVNLVVAASTSSGKTIVAEQMILGAVSKGKKGIFLSPLKAVTQEKYDDWVNPKHPFSQYNLSIVTGDYRLTDERKKELAKADIILMTSEMLDSRTRLIDSEKNTWLYDADVVVVDEAHLLTMKGRGDSLESGIMRFTKLVPESRVVLLSATMPNTKDIVRWLTKMNKKRTGLIQTDWRPVKLDVHFVGHLSRGGYYQKEDDKIFKTISIIQTHARDKFLVFVHTKATGNKLIKELEKQGIKSYFHSADLNLQDRLYIERTFKDKSLGLRVIVATSTLAWGINMPARRCIVLGVHRGLGEVSELDIVQMVGRAGRFGIDEKGDSYVLVPDGKMEWEYHVNRIENIGDIVSRFTDRDVLAFHAVSEINNKKVYDEISFWKWYSRSLANFQGQPFKIEDCEEVLQKLQELKCVSKWEGKVKTTSLGKVCAWLYMSPFDVNSWWKNMLNVVDKGYFDSDRGFSHEDIDNAMAWMLGNVPSACTFTTKDAEDFMIPVNNFCASNGFELFPNENNESPLPAVSAYHFLINQEKYKQRGFNVPLRIRAQARGLSWDIERTMSAIKMIDNFVVKKNLEKDLKLLQVRFMYGVERKMAELCLIKWVGAKTAKELYSNGIRSVESFVEKRRMAKAIMMKRHKEARESAFEVLGIEEE